MALTLRTLRGLSTDEIALALLVPFETMSKRLTRAKHKIRDAVIPSASRQLGLCQPGQDAAPGPAAADGLGGLSRPAELR